MSSFDDLAEIYVRTLNNGHGVMERSEQGIIAAAAIISAGYRKPRTITTAGELDALPDESVVRSDFGVIHEKDCDFDSDEPYWSCVGIDGRYGSGRVTLPATVIYEPTQ